jgi:thiol-disulfide isomerase/thioredoxin
MVRGLLIALLSCAAVELVYAKTTSIKDVKEYREVVKSQGPKVIVFSSSTCTACDSHMQALEEVAKNYPQVGYFSFNVEDLPDLRKELDIKYYPTTHFHPSGKKFDRSIGSAEFDEILYESVNGKKKPAPAPAPRKPSPERLRKI